MLKPDPLKGRLSRWIRLCESPLGPKLTRQILSTTTHPSHPFLYNNGQLLDLGLPQGAIEANAVGINNRETIIGTSTLGEWVYANGKFQFLEDLIPAGYYVNVNCRMNFSRRYDIRIPQLNERIHEFLRTKHLTGLVEHEFENVNEPTGWAILTVDTADPQLQHELDGFISTLERIAVRESELVG